MLILSRMGYWTRTEWWNYCYSCFLKELWGSSLDRAGRARPQLRLYAISCLPADVDTCQQHQPCPLTLGKKQEKKRTFKENLILKKIDLYWKRWTPRNSPYQLRVRICFTDVQVLFSDALRSLPHCTVEFSWKCYYTGCRGFWEHSVFLWNRLVWWIKEESIIPTWFQLLHTL